GGRADDPLIGIRYQAALEKAAYEMTGGTYAAPLQWARDFLAGRTTTDRPPSSYPRGIRGANLWELLPPTVARLLHAGLPLMDQQWHGLFLRGATLTGPEARGSCPVRLPRDPETRASVGVPGLYPIGEGAGYAGGIVSAAVDGLRTARAVVAVYRPLRR